MPRQGRTTGQEESRSRRGEIERAREREGRKEKEQLEQTL